MNPSSDIYLLAVEAAVMGGSLALIGDGRILDHWTGEGASSRAEDLLLAVDELCERSIGGAANLGKIVVSLGPGSYTGLRIGIASALGLAKGLGIDCVGVRLLDAMAYCSKKVGGLIAALPMGRSDICYQRFDREGEPASEIVSLSRPNFESFVNQLEDTHLIIPEILTDIQFDSIINAGDCLARQVGIYAITQPLTGELSAIYVQNPRMA